MRTETLQRVRVGKAEEFNKMMTENAFDVGTHNNMYLQKMEEFHKVRMTKEDEAFYEDNCKGEYKATCSDFVSRKWEKSSKRSIKRGESENQKKEEIQNKKEEELK